MTTYSNLRYNPINGTTSGRAISEAFTIAELDELPGVYGFRLTDQVLSGSTPTVVVNTTGGASYTVITTGSPLAGQLYIQYSTGLCIANVSDNGVSLLVSYTGIGSGNHIANLSGAIADDIVALVDQELMLTGYTRLKITQTTTTDRVDAGSILHVNSLLFKWTSNSSAITGSGAAGWRYIVCTDAGVLSYETIPVAEISADTEVFSPRPVFNTTQQGYYSTVNTTRRIIGVRYWTGSVFTYSYLYGCGDIRNDNYFEARGFSARITDGVRWATFAFRHGDTLDYTFTDDGTNATILTANRPGVFHVSASGTQASGSTQQFCIRKNGDLSVGAETSNRAFAYIVNNGGGTVSAAIPVQQGDFVRVLSGAGLVNDNFAMFTARFEAS